MATGARRWYRRGGPDGADGPGWTGRVGRAAASAGLDTGVVPEDLEATLLRPTPTGEAGARATAGSTDSPGYGANPAGYKSAIDDQLQDAVAALAAFHVVKLGTVAVDEVRRQVQQGTLGHRGRKGDPLLRIQRILRVGEENLTDK